MTFYQVMIEGVFVRLDGVSGRYGFHATFYVVANNSRNAVSMVCKLIADRMNAHNVAEIKTETFKTYFYVHDIWEITEEKFFENSGIDFGFTFFPIGFFERFQLFFRHLLLKRMKPQRLVDVKGVIHRKGEKRPE